MRAYIAGLCLLLMVTTPLLAAEKVEGKLNWAQRVELSTLVSGTVEIVAVQAGQQVKAGDLLMRLDQRKFNAELAKRNAILSKAQAEHEEAKRELERTQELYDRTLISDHELQMAKIGFTRAEASLKKAQAEQVQAKLDVEYTELHAPFDAVILQKQLEPGQVIQSQWRADPLIVIAKAGAMLAEAQVSAAVLAKLQLGQKITVQLAGKSFKGKLQSMSKEPVDKAAKTAHYTIGVYIETGNNPFAAGTEATLVIP